MAKLPGYDSSKVMSTEPSVQMKDMAQEQQMGKNIQSLGKVARDLATVWQDAEDAAQTLEGQNKIDLGQADVFDRAAKDPKYDNSEEYHDDLEKIREGSLENFTNDQARQKFAITANNQTAAARIKVDGVFRTKFQDHYKGQIITSHEKNKREYISTGDEAAMDKQRLAVGIALEKGAVSEVFVANEEVKIQDWNHLRYLQMAQNGQVEEALKMIDESDMQPSEKNAAKASIMTMARQGAIISQIEQINAEQQMFAESDAFIDDPDKSYVEKLDFLEQQKKFGLSAADYTKLLGSLTSANKIAAESHAEANADIALSIARMDGGITQKKDGMRDIGEYLRSLKKTRELITDKHAQGVITRAEKTDFIADLNKIVEEEENIATNKIKKKTLAAPGFGLFTYGYDDAYKDMQENLEAPGLIDKAFLDFYYENIRQRQGPGTLKQGMLEKDRKASVIRIIDRYNEKLVSEIKEEMRARTGLRPKAVTPVEEILKKSGATMANVEAAAKKHGVTTDEVIRRMRAEHGKP